MLKQLSFIFILIFLCSITIGQAAKYKPKDTFTEKKSFILFDFNKKSPLNNVSGQFGVFSANPKDTEASISYRYKKDKTLHKKGYNLYIKYDVDSSQTAFNGIWTKLNGLDLSQFNAFSITIKGDKKKGFNDSFKIELKTKTDKIETSVEDITDKWQKIVIPFEEFEGVIEDFDFSNLYEFNIVFEDWKFKKKEGAYYIDDIGFIPKKGKKIKFSTMLKKRKVKKK